MNSYLFKRYGPLAYISTTDVAFDQWLRQAVTHKEMGCGDLFVTVEAAKHPRILKASHYVSVADAEREADYATALLDIVGRCIAENVTHIIFTHLQWRYEVHEIDAPAYARLSAQVKDRYPHHTEDDEMMVQPVALIRAFGGDNNPEEASLYKLGKEADQRGATMLLLTIRS